MSGTLMKSVSGIRGIVGDTFTPELICKAAPAFAKFAGSGTVVVGRDSRPTGEALSMNIISSLILSGCDVVDIGIVPTPSVQIMVEELKASAGIVVSASHNPVEWNALKLINREGTFLLPGEVKKFFALMEQQIPFKKWDKIGSLKKISNASEIHIQKILDAVDISIIKKKKFHVVIDSVNGAGSLITPELLKKLGCKVTEINCIPDGFFPRGAEPLPENLEMLSKAVIENKADIGFAQDPDADRLAVVDEKGKPLGEEYTITLVADHLLNKKTGRVVVNLSTTRAVEEIAARYGAPFTRTKVGEINVVENMKKKGARIGGEGNGGVISPEIHLGRDSLAGIGYILEMMAEKNIPVSEIMESMPQYYMKKGKLILKSSSQVPSIIEKIKDTYSGEKISLLDGLRIDFVKSKELLNGWVHLRSSNTEPVFRVIAESDSPEKTEMIYRLFAKMIR